MPRLPEAKELLACQCGSSIIQHALVKFHAPANDVRASLWTDKTSSFRHRAPNLDQRVWQRQFCRKVQKPTLICCSPRAALNQLECYASPARSRDFRYQTCLRANQSLRRLSSGIYARQNAAAIAWMQVYCDIYFSSLTVTCDTSYLSPSVPLAPHTPRPQLLVLSLDLACGQQS